MLVAHYLIKIAVLARENVLVKIVPKNAKATVIGNIKIAKNVTRNVMTVMIKKNVIAKIKRSKILIQICQGQLGLGISLLN